MIRYLTDLAHVYKPKNKLEDQVLEYLKTETRQLIPSSQVRKYKELILNAIGTISEKHPRCKPINCYWWALHDDDAGIPEEHHSYRLSLNNHSICIFTLTAGEEVEI